MSQSVDKLNADNQLIRYLGEVAPFLVSKDQPVGQIISALLEFAVDSKRLLQRCTKPDAKEFKRTAQMCSAGFLIMGVIGYVVKLVFIPINNILVGMGA